MPTLDAQQKRALRWVLIEALDLHYARDLKPDEMAAELSDLKSLTNLLEQNGGSLAFHSNPDESAPDSADPDLLAALQATLNHIDDDMNGRRVVLWKLRETVCAAIAKAEGTPAK